MSELHQQLVTFARRHPRELRACNVLSALVFSALIFAGGGNQPGDDALVAGREAGRVETRADVAACGTVRPVLAWGAGGHYWAVLGTALLSGYSLAKAQRLAFFAWLPDQVNEFDAAFLYTLWLKLRASETVSDAAIAASASSGGVPIVIVMTPPRASQNTNRALGLNLPLLENMPLRRYIDVIHKGLHCLNGGSAVAETERRRETSLALAATANDDRLFGISLHSFGDSFAHREVGVEGEPRMYEVGIGHAIEVGSRDVFNENPAWFRKRFPGGIVSPEAKGEAVDYLDFRPENTVNYVVSLYNLLMDVRGTNDPRMPIGGWPEEVPGRTPLGPPVCPTPRRAGEVYAANYARDVLARTMDDKEAGERTRAWAAKLWGSAVIGAEWSYNPHRSHLPWELFFQTNDAALRFGLQRSDLGDWLATVMRWANQR